MIRVVLTVAVLMGLLGAAPALADTPAQMCKGIGTDNELRPVPSDLTDKATALFGSDVKARQGSGPVWRCMDERAFVCVPGGDRYCGRADTQVMATPDAEAYCRSNPGTGTIPSGVTGRDTIFKWTCDGKHARNAGAIRTVDPRGFVADYWKVME